MQSKSLLLGLLFAVPLSTACSSAPPSGEQTAATGQEITTSDIMGRARAWVADAVPYCGGVNGGTDYICGGTCNRPFRAWDNFRTDCSGFVSWAWQIMDDPSTSEYISDRSGSSGWSTIAIDSLQAGDALVTNGHIKLFSAFAGAGAANILEEYDCNRVAHEQVQSFSRTGNTLYFSGDSRPYHPIRRHGLGGGPPPPPPPPPPSACGVHGDGKLYCTNAGNAAMYSASHFSSGVVNHLRTTSSWFDCWGSGERHAGGNTTWYHTVGDDNGNWGYVPASDLNTSSAFDANPSAHGLRQCGGSSPPPPPVDPACSVHSDARLHCGNTSGATMHAGVTLASEVVDHLRTTPSWFDCWGTGERHAGGNTTWYHTMGDDNGHWGYVPAVDLHTSSAFDANPSAAGLKHCP